MRNIIPVLLFLFLVKTNMFSQSDKAITAADKKFENFEFVDARQVYLDVVKSGYKSENILKKIADSYYFNNELIKSLEWYENLYNFQKKIDAEYLFRYAMALKSIKRYDLADKIMDEYYLQLDSKYDKNKERSKKSYTDRGPLNNYKFNIAKSSINSGYSDFSPSYYLNKLAFTSNRMEQQVGNQKQQISKWNNLPFSDLYMVAIKRDNQLDSQIEKFSDLINSEYHESSPAFTKDGNIIYFTRNNFDNKRFRVDSKGVNLLKIFKSEKNSKGMWSLPVELPFNSDNYSCAHPALSPDGKKLYFSSDMPGTFGMSDLYFVDINWDGSYGIPVNLGTTINTTGRESYPFISGDNQLFFSSDGHLGLGGFDVFVTNLKEFDFNSPVVNIGDPVNSSFDDFSFIYNSADRTGFFASNRNNLSGFDDIYGFKMVRDLSACSQVLSGIAQEKVSRKNLSNVTVTLFSENLKVMDQATTDEYGGYKFLIDCNESYVVRFLLEGFQTIEKNIISNSEVNKTIIYNPELVIGNLLGEENINIGADIAEVLQLETIYFDFDKSNIRPDAEIELQKVIAFLKKNQSVKIDVRSHTDSQGSRDYNLVLSGKRANATIDYFVRNGIAKSRLSGKGYGDTQVINGCVRGVKCSEAEHQFNRRSEFIVVEKNDFINDDKLPLKNTDKNSDAINSSITNEKKLGSVNTATSEIVINSKTWIYDFDSSVEIYTVQLGALNKPSQEAFIEIPAVFKNTYKDGFTRYFVGAFTTKKNALSLQSELSKRGLKNTFVVKLKGNTLPVF